MLLPKKTQGFFVEINNHGVLLARSSSRSGPMVLEALKSCAPNDAEGLGAALRELQPKRTGAYLHASCGVYPENRLVRRASLEPKRYSEENYLNEVVNAQFRLEADKHTLAILNPKNGHDFDLAHTQEKEALFVGMANAEAEGLQKQLLEKGIFPESLELASLSTIGAVLDYMVFSNLRSPTLVLEIDTDSTQSFIISDNGLDATRPIQQGLGGMLPIVQKELGLRDEESARKLFYSNTFDFTGMGPLLIKKLLKELQSSIGFYEVQTGQSIGQVVCTMLPSKLGWLEAALANQLGVGMLKVDFENWLPARGVNFANKAMATELDVRWLGLVGLMLSNNHAFPAEKKS